MLLKPLPLLVSRQNEAVSVIEVGGPAIKRMPQRVVPRPGGNRVGAEVCGRAQEAGLILRSRGDVLTLAPPFVITEGQIDRLVAVLRAAIAEATEAAR